MKKILLMGAIGLCVFGFGQEKADLKQIYSLADNLKKSNNSEQRDSIIVEMKKIRDNLGDFDKTLANTFINVSQQLVDAKKTAVQSKKISELSKADLKGFVIDEDKFKHSVFITNRWGFNNPALQPYISVHDDNAYLRIRTQYYGSGWIFMNAVQFIIDGKDFSYNVSDPNRNVISGSSVSEISDQVANEDQINILKEIVNSKENVAVRFSGDRYRDTTIDAGAKKKIKEVLDLFEKLKK